METYEKIRKLREDAHLNQEDVALGAGIPRSSYAKFEKPGKLRQDRVQQIADFYGVDVSTLAPDETYVEKLLREQGHTEPEPNILHEPNTGSFIEKPDDWINEKTVTRNERLILRYYRLSDDEGRKLIMELAKKLGTK